MRLSLRPVLLGAWLAASLVGAPGARAGGEGLPATATRTDKLTAPGAVTALELSVLNGGIRIGAGKSFAATVELTVRGRDQAAAAAALARTKVRLSFDGGRVKLDTDLNRDGDRDDWRHSLETRYQVTLPPGASVRTNAVNASVRIEGITGPIKADTVNGGLEVVGAGSELQLRSVNGRVEAHVAELGRSQRVKADTVNGPLTLWLPAKAALRLQARTLNGDIVSTLAFPPRTETRGFGPIIGRSYEGEVGGGGGEVKMNSVNGRIAVLAAGSSEAQAKPLVTITGPSVSDGGRGKRWFAWAGGSDDVRRGSVDGDFVLDGASADVKVDSVSGQVRLRTHAGDVKIGVVGKGAEIDTEGGDIRVRSVKAGLQARSGGGDVRVDEVGADARLETGGGDIHLGACGGSVTARTRGGDISVRRARGAVNADSDGGDILVEVVGRETAGGIQLATQGGDVTLILPANYRGDIDLEARAVEAGERFVVSEFPEIPVTRGAGVHVAKGKLGGGGPKVVVRTQSGTITLRKGPGL
jgi:DUF4097 and DUF4098 domain-containing protein YvlB